MNTTMSRNTAKLAKEVEEIPLELLPSMLKAADESFRNGFEEALCNELHPVSELWEGIDAE